MSLRSLQVGRAGRHQSLGRADARMVGALAAAALQFCGHPDRRLAPSACGKARLGPKATRCPRSIAACCWMRARRRIATSALDAVPDMMLEMPEDSFAPAVLARRV